MKTETFNFDKGLLWHSRLSFLYALSSLGAAYQLRNSTNWHFIIASVIAIMPAIILMVIVKKTEKSEDRKVARQQFIYPAYIISILSFILIISQIWVNIVQLN
jgi:heme O synthase-like polyprenyltransferase